jgi:hypothetical protein
MPELLRWWRPEKLRVIDGMCMDGTAGLKNQASPSGAINRSTAPTPPTTAEAGFRASAGRVEGLVEVV